MKKKLAALLIAVLISTSAVFATGCNKSTKVDSNQNTETDEKADTDKKDDNNKKDDTDKKDDSKQDLKKLADCLKLTSSVDSMEGDIVTGTKLGEQSLDIKMNIKIENIKSGMKSVVTMDILGQKQEIYIAVVGGKYNMYSKDAAGKYTMLPADSAQTGQIDFSKSFNAYVDIVEKIPEMVSIESDNKYKISIPKEKASEFYTKITGNEVKYAIENLDIEFVIGQDGYLKEVNLKAKANSMDIKVDTKYFNYGKKFNIVMPKVS